MGDQVVGKAAILGGDAAVETVPIEALGASVQLRPLSDSDLALADAKPYEGREIPLDAVTPNGGDRDGEAGAEEHADGSESGDPQRRVFDLGRFQANKHRREVFIAARALSVPGGEQWTEADVERIPDRGAVAEIAAAAMRITRDHREAVRRFRGHQ